jgi:DNA primase
MALPPGFLEELRARTPLAGLVGRRVRLARSGKQWKGCCPFHGEKTPSFYVYDDGYHCFGCGAHGDAITFVMQSQGLPFMGAITQLAAEAGLDVPQPSPEAAEAERRRLDVVGVLDVVQAHYQRRLGLPEGRAARDYLLGRGLAEDTIARESTSNSLLTRD